MNTAITTPPAGSAAWPSISFWDSNARKIELINPEDLHIEERLRFLGLNDHPLKHTFGCADHAEILRRQKLVKTLVESAKLRAATTKNTFACSASGPFPDNGDDFLHTYGKGRGSVAPFWEHMDALVAAINDLPNEARTPELMELKSVIEKENSDSAGSARSREMAMVDSINAILRKVIVFSGIYHIDVTYIPDGDKAGHWRVQSADEKKFVGHRLFSDDLPPEFPTLLDNGSSGIVNWFYQLVDKIRMRRFNEQVNEWAEAIRIRKASPEVRRAVQRYVEGIFSESSTERWANLFPERATCKLVINFSYDQNGLVIRLIDVLPRDQYANEDDANNYQPLPNTMRSVRSSRVAGLVQEGREVAIMAGELLWKRDHMTVLMQRLKEIHPEFLQEKVALTDFKFGDEDSLSNLSVSFSIRGILALDSTLMAAYEYANAFRAWCIDTLNGLSHVNLIAERFAKLSETTGLALHWPVIKDDKANSFVFGKLMPVCLIGRKKPGSEERIKPADLVPVTALNDVTGQTVMLLGQNAGGKTATLEEMQHSTHDAQSSFPLLGAEGIVINVKTVIGSMSLDRGHGSTMQLQLEKAGRIIVAAQRHAHNGTVIFLDELGTGTQDVDGAEVGECILDRLRETECSVVATTQLTRLAERARAKGAKCYSFDAKHQVTEGIRGGNVRGLAARVGVAHILGLPASDVISN